MTRRYVIPAMVLEDSRAFFLDRAKQGCEGTGLLVGPAAAETVRVSHFFAPEQRCIKTPLGLRVELTEWAHYTLTDNLAPDERFHARIHSHPENAYHSALDDDNEILSHEGAISIVVPRFARDPIDLLACAIYRFTRRQGWMQLGPPEVRTLFEVTHE